MITRKDFFRNWFFYYLGIPLAILFCSRIIFYIYYKDFYTSYSLLQIFWNLLHGVRFDFATVFLLYGIFLLPILITPKNWQIPILKILSFLAVFFNFSILFIAISGIGFFQESGRHLSFEFLFFFTEFSSIIDVALQNHLLMVILGLVVIFFSIFLNLKLSIWFFKKEISPSFKKKNPISFLKNIRQRLIVLFIIVFFARGGWQLRPLEVTHAFYQGSQILGSLAFAAPFSVLKFFSNLPNPINPKNWIEKKEATTITKKLLSLGNKKNTFLNEDYPFYRQNNNNLLPKKKNLVIIAMESWGKSYLSPETTPFFNKLKEKGILFENFYSTGTRSVQGISSIMFSLPNIEETPIYQNPFVSNRMSSLAGILANNNYENIFFHAGEDGTFWLHNLARVAGYQKAFSIKDLENTPKRYDGSWGLWDHFTFLDFAKELDKLKPPFHGFFLSLNPHSPYNIPDEKFIYFDKTVPNYKYLNSLRYSDWALQQFFTEAKKYNWYKETIFVILADHNYGIFKSKKKNYQIPLLIFTPSGEIPRKKNQVIGSHIDVAPTILSLLNISADAAFTGKSLLDMSKEKSYTLVSTNFHHWITSEYIYIFTENKLQKILRFKDESEVDINSAKDLHQNNINNFLGFFQTGFNAILENKIIPPK